MRRLFIKLLAFFLLSWVTEGLDSTYEHHPTVRPLMGHRRVTLKLRFG